MRMLVFVFQASQIRWANSAIHRTVGVSLCLLFAVSFPICVVSLCGFRPVSSLYGSLSFMLLCLLLVSPPDRRYLCFSLRKRETGSCLVAFQCAHLCLFFFSVPFLDHKKMSSLSLCLSSRLRRLKETPQRPDGGADPQIRHNQSRAGTCCFPEASRGGVVV